MPNLQELKKQRLRKLTAKEAAELDEIEARAICTFKGQLDDLEKAIGMLRLGYHMGWQVLVLVHSKRTVRKYEGILGITFREYFDPEGPSSNRSLGLKLAKKFNNFWKVVSGETKIEDRKTIA